jgi:hypothetical protein
MGFQVNSFRKDAISSRDGIFTAGNYLSENDIFGYSFILPCEKKG